VDNRAKKQFEDLTSMREASRIICYNCGQTATYSIGRGDKQKLYCSKHYWQIRPEKNKMIKGFKP